MRSEDRLGRDAIDELLGRLGRQRAPTSSRHEGLPELPADRRGSLDGDDRPDERAGVPERKGVSERTERSPERADAEPALARGLLDAVRLRVRVELGRKRLRLDEALSLESGRVVELDSSSESPVTIWVGDTPIARGEVLVVDDRFCVRITEVLQPTEEAEE